MNVTSGSESSGDPSRGMRVALDLSISSDVNEIEHVVELVQRECAELRLPPHHCSLNVPVALSEALSNAILRGNAEDESKHVRVRACVGDDRLVLEVSDEGKGFDMDRCIIDPTTPEHLEREDGRGLFLMKQLMDRVERFSQGGNVVRLTLLRR
jgi:serine/threonine-protein kinase RsbW